MYFFTEIYIANIYSCNWVDKVIKWPPDTWRSYYRRHNTSIVFRRHFKHVHTITQTHTHTFQTDTFLHAVGLRPAQPRLRHANNMAHTFSQLYPDTHTPTVWRRQFEGPHLACLSLPVCSVWPSLFICLIKKSDPPACHDILMADF